MELLEGRTLKHAIGNRPCQRTRFSSLPFRCRTF